MVLLYSLLRSQNALSEVSPYVLPSAQQFLACWICQVIPRLPRPDPLHLGIEPVIRKEWRHPRTFGRGGVIGMLRKRQHIGPIILLEAGIMPKIALQNLVQSFGLSIRLRMESG